MTAKEQQAIETHLANLRAVADELRQAADQLRRGELNQWHAANRITKLARQLAGERT
jgi:hypothetical protein